MQRTFAAAFALIVCGATLFGTRASAQDAAPEPCGTTTLEGRIADPDGDGTLECIDGEGYTVREDLAAAQSGREDRRTPLLSFFTIADVQLPDEESPLRAEWADKCGDTPTSGAFRPHESLVAQMMNAHVVAANRIAGDGSPALGTDFAFTMALGDMADNQHRNEIRWIIDIMDGGMLVDPDSGADGYDGVQGNDPDGAGDLELPPAAVGAVPPTHADHPNNEDQPLLYLANEPFVARGLENPDGSPVPWYSVQGNHDAKVQGTVKDDTPGWREFARGYAVGGVKVTDLNPERQQEACEGGYQDPAFYQDLFGDAATDPTLVGGVKAVPPDPDRILVNKQQWIDAHGDTTGLPEGHGFLPQDVPAQGLGAPEMCPDDYDDPFTRRACYSFVRTDPTGEAPPIKVIALDTNPAEGAEQGNIDPAQWSWLTEELAEASTSFYGPDGTPVDNPGATDHLIVVVTHHTMTTLNNRETSNLPGSDARHGDDLEELLLRFPNVIMHTNGHTHQNKIWPHADDERDTAYWEVNTSAVTDWPHQSRTIELADNDDGTLSIFATIFDAAVHPDARSIDWSAHDHTHETEHGHDHDVNEDWLAAAGLEEAFNDPQQNTPDAIGAAEDRNVELLLAHPEPAEDGSNPVVNAPEGTDGATGAAPLPATGPASVGSIALGLAFLAVLAALRRHDGLALRN